MQVFPSRRTVARAQARWVLRFFLVMALLATAFAVALAGHYALGLW